MKMLAWLGALAPLLGAAATANATGPDAAPLPTTESSIRALVVAPAEGDTDALSRAKALFFDRRYTEARTIWEGILRSAKGSEAETAAFWVARCSDNAGESDRALAEYQAFLDRRPKDAALAEEARTSRVGLATRLFKAGQRQHLPLLEQALKDPSKTVRYFAALQLGGLGPRVGMPAVPVLKTIVAEEKDTDLVDRAKILLLRLDPTALRDDTAKRTTPPAGTSGREVKWLKMRIFEKGRSQPSVSLNLPVGFAEMVYRSLPEDAVKDLKREGYDAENFWERLKKLGPTQILEIIGDDGETIQIWLE